MLLLGGGVVATAIPTRSKGLGGGRLLIDFGRGPIPNKGTTCCCRR